MSWNRWVVDDSHRVKTPILEAKHLAISYEIRHGQVNAVRDVSFKVHRGETLGIVGESGCGKSTVAFGIVRFLGRNGNIVGGSIQFQGQELRDLSKREMRHLRGDQMAMVYQDPFQSLNPSMRIGDQLSEVLTEHRNISKEEAYDRAIEMLQQVYMPDPEAVMERYPHQLSGGQQQRVVIGMALLNNPALLIMDEPTTALDVTVEAAVLDLVDELRRRLDTGVLYITHDLGVIARVADNVGVMYAGEMVELASAEDIFLRPMHPYTEGLMRCIPKLGVSKESSYLYPIRGRVPAPVALPPGCIFEPRCDYARRICREEHPELREASPDHLARCHFAEDIFETEWQPSDETIKDLEERLGKRTNGDEEVLRVENAKTYYEQASKSVLSLVGLGDMQHVKAVDGVSFDVKEGMTLGVVGESGCGKSTLAKTIIGLEAPRDGEMEFLGFDLTEPLSKRDRRVIKELQMVFQNPDSTLNPSFSVGFQIARPLRLFGDIERDKVDEEVVRLLNDVRLDASYYDRFPRQLSGGEKQRVGVARAFATHPELVLCDEPVSSLDVSVQAAVLNLLMEIQQKHGNPMLFIAHDLSVVRFFSDYIMVMYLGKTCEIGPSEAVYAPPYHPYTEALLSAVPTPDPRIKQRRIRLSGTVPSALNPPTGCRFNTRCPRKVGEICETVEPPVIDAGDGHRIYCHIPLEELKEIEPVLTAD
jgi:peptide/nickel transport system ATP-binding protein